MVDYRFPAAFQMLTSIAMAEQAGKHATSSTRANSLVANPSIISKLIGTSVLKCN